MNNEEKDLYYVGTFNVGGKAMIGSLIIKQDINGIFLAFSQNITPKDIVEIMGAIRKKLVDYSVITGETTGGVMVSLFNCEVIKNHLTNFQRHELQFKADYLIWGSHSNHTSTFNALSIKTSNLLLWSGLSGITDDYNEKEKEMIVKHKFQKKKVLTIDDYTISFDTTILWDILSSPRKEKSIVSEHVIINIENKNKKVLKDLLRVKDIVFDLIAFGIKNNIEIEEMKLDSAGCQLVLSERKLKTFKNSPHDYNYGLSLIPAKIDSLLLEKLHPVLNLYLAAIKYPDMPIEVNFLNIIQAVETFHARFICNEYSKYEKSIDDRYSMLPKTQYDYWKNLLWEEPKNNTAKCGNPQPDCLNGKFISLKTRIIDLLVYKGNGLFNDFTKTILPKKLINTRNYFTHYGEELKNKVLSGDELQHAVFFMIRLLDFHICSLLGIDIRTSVVESIKDSPFIHGSTASGQS